MIYATQFLAADGAGGSTVKPHGRRNSLNYWGLQRPWTSYINLPLAGQAAD
ncbi:hypothetical protein [Arthrobacter sp. Soil736]|uniref:hypothetical protein n=1 Tax=Arthrobacter sp. Soil736 TaxID=1736395 RepID=UPI000A68293D|nr:hypothetical protein [Arthrobacter sp. Soil736]